MAATIQLSPQRRFALTVVVMGASVIQVLDSTIANVALPHMQAALGASPDQVSWILTSYIIASAVAMPLSGWLEARMGRHWLVAVSIAGFTLASMLCGIAITLPMMIGARVLQGAFGAFLGPLSQAILLDIYPEEQRANAMTIWGIGIMAGPIMGPVLGGWLTDNFDWRWVFFINVPIGALSLAGALVLMPRIRERLQPFDGWGFAMLAVALCAMQLALDRGTDRDWFHSPEILIETAVAIAAFWMFAVHTITAREPLLPVALFKDRNFLVANIFVLVVFGVMMSAAALLPPMMQRLLGYDTLRSGLLTMPRGVAMMISMILMSRVLKKVDMRLVIVTGMAMIATAQWMMTGFDLEMDQRPIIYTGLLQGAGLGMVMVPLNLLAFSTLSPRLRTSAASLYSLTRNIGASLTIAMFSAFLARNQQISHSDLVSSLSLPKMAVSGAQVQTELVARMIDAEINRQAVMIAYIDDFWLMAVLSFLMLPLAFLLKPVKSGPQDMSAMVME
mgnify:CR=1 FL=1